MSRSPDDVRLFILYNVFSFTYQYCVSFCSLDKKTKDCQQAENLARHYETRYTEESNKYNTALADKKKAQDEARVCINLVHNL